MQPLKATARPSAASTHRLRAALGEVDDRQPPVHEPGVRRATQTPSPSGPRGASAAAIRSSAATVGGAVAAQLSGEPAHGSGPQRPHAAGRLAPAAAATHERGEQRRVRRVVDTSVSACHCTPSAKCWRVGLDRLDDAVGRPRDGAQPASRAGRTA